MVDVGGGCEGGAAAAQYGLGCLRDDLRTDQRRLLEGKKQPHATYDRAVGTGMVIGIGMGMGVGRQAGR